MVLRPPRYTRTVTRFPDTTLFRVAGGCRDRDATPPNEAGARCAHPGRARRTPRRNPRTNGRNRERVPRVEHARGPPAGAWRGTPPPAGGGRSEEHTSELPSLMRISYSVFCLNKKKKNYINSY